MSSTHIRVDETTWKRLNALKTPGDDFNAVIERVLDDRDEDQPRTNARVIDTDE